MKTYFGTMLRGALALTAMLVCGAGSVSNATTPVSPVGTWDCTFSGAGGQKGLAFLTFSDNGTNRTFDGFELLVANPSTSTPDPNVRNVGIEPGRNIFDSSGSLPSILTPEQTLLGFGEISGPWSYDNKGRVIGYFVQLVNASGVTTNFGTTCVSNQFVLVTNSALFVTNISVCFDTPTFTTNVTFTTPTNQSASFTFANTNFSVGPSTVQSTNQISFVGKVSTSKHLTLNCSTSFGNASYHGTPYTTNLKNLTGAWQATRKENGQTFIETFDLTSFGTGNPFPTNTISDTITNFPNIYYTTNNSGAGYTNAAISALSSHKKIGFVFATDPLRSALGSFSSTKSATKANTKGLELPATSFTYKANLVQ